MEQQKTMIEIYVDDRKDLNLLKIQTDAKNIPSVLHRAVELLKAQIKKEDKKNE